MIEIHTLKWRGDSAVDDADMPTEPNDVSIYCRVFVDGKEIENVQRAHTRHRQDFTLTTITLIQPVEVVNHTHESWEALDK